MKRTWLWNYYHQFLHQFRAEFFFGAIIIIIISVVVVAWSIDLSLQQQLRQQQQAIYKKHFGRIRLVFFLTFLCVLSSLLKKNSNNFFCSNIGKDYNNNNTHTPMNQYRTKNNSFKIILIEYIMASNNLSLSFSFGHCHIIHVCDRKSSKITRKKMEKNFLSCRHWPKNKTNRK